MEREYQVRRAKAFVLPETVYRQALWAAKDYNRLKEEIEFLTDNLDAIRSPSLVREVGSSPYLANVTAQKAEKLAALTGRIDKINEALEMVSEPYREGIANKIFNGIKFSDEAHANTWKRWQQIFLYYVAKNLELW